MLQHSVNSWKAFSASCWLWKHFPWKKVVKMLKEVVVGWWEVKWIWWLRPNFVVQSVQLWKPGLRFYNQSGGRKCFPWFLFWLIKMCLGLVKIISNSGSEIEITFASTKCFCFIGYTTFDCVDYNKLWKILKEMGIPDDLTCPLQNLYAGQEATVRTRHGKMNWERSISRLCIVTLLI